jgi:CRISP-associated protein Cas1
MSILLQSLTETQNTIRVSALHALAYCPRLFYLEEVEELYRTHLTSYGT